VLKWQESFAANLYKVCATMDLDVEGGESNVPKNVCTCRK